MRLMMSRRATGRGLSVSQSRRSFADSSGRYINSFTRWIYAVPYVHRFQYFEMPLLGLFGYIPFGIECLVITDAWMKRREGRWREKVEVEK